MKSFFVYYTCQPDKRGKVHLSPDHTTPTLNKGRYVYLSPCTFLLPIFRCEAALAHCQYKTIRRSYSLAVPVPQDHKSRIKVHTFLGHYSLESNRMKVHEE